MKVFHRAVRVAPYVVVSVASVVCLADSAPPSGKCPGGASSSGERIAGTSADVNPALLAKVRPLFEGVRLRRAGDGPFFGAVTEVARVPLNGGRSRLVVWVKVIVPAALVDHGRGEILIYKDAGDEQPMVRRAAHTLPILDAAEITLVDGRWLRFGSSRTLVSLTEDAALEAFRDHGLDEPPVGLSVDAPSGSKASRATGDPNPKATAKKAEAPPKSAEQAPPRISPEQAVGLAAQGLGLKEFDRADAHARLVSLSHESLPFLAKSLSGRSAFRIEFTNLTLEKASGRPRLANSHIRRLVVFLAPDSGQIMKVTSVWPKDVARIAEYPSCAEEERQMGENDRYVGLPGDAPQVSLFEAIEKAVPWGPDVKQIHATYVRHSTSRYQDRPVWVIQLRGFEPFPSSIPGGIDVTIPRDSRNHLRNLIDAQTGKWLGADTIPQPEGPLENRY